MLLKIAKGGEFEIVRSKKPHCPTIVRQKPHPRTIETGQLRADKSRRTNLAVGQGQI